MHPRHQIGIGPPVRPYCLACLGSGPGSHTNRLGHAHIEQKKMWTFCTFISESKILATKLECSCATCNARLKLGVEPPVSPQSRSNTGARSMCCANY
jgi:hypothetical protein